MTLKWFNACIFNLASFMDWVHLCICSGQIDEIYVFFPLSSLLNWLFTVRMYFGGFCLYFACEALDACSGFWWNLKNPRTCAQSVRLRRHAVIGDAPKMRQRQPNEKLLTFGINNGGIGKAAERAKINVATVVMVEPKLVFDCEKCVYDAA